MSFDDVGNAQRYGEPVIVPQQMFARLLYTNPVCILTTSRGTKSHALPPHPRLDDMSDRSSSGKADDNNSSSQHANAEVGPDVNAMTISWLTPTTNVAGGFMMSMNTGRYTANLIKETKRFGAFMLLLLYCILIIYVIY